MHSLLKTRLGKLLQYLLHREFEKCSSWMDPRSHMFREHLRCDNNKEIRTSIFPFQSYCKCLSKKMSKTIFQTLLVIISLTFSEKNIKTF